jgi:hypothetical protein
VNARYGSSVLTSVRRPFSTSRETIIAEALVEFISDAYLELATKVISPSPASFIPATPVMTMFSSPAISPPTRAPISLSETSICYLLFYPGSAERAEERRNRANPALLGNLPPLKKLSLVSGNQLPNIAAISVPDLYSSPVMGVLWFLSAQSLCGYASVSFSPFSALFAARVVI